MHILGLLGMPRRVYTYHAGLGWDGAEPDRDASAAFVFGLGTLLDARQLRAGAGAAARPPARTRGARDTLEWSTTSPPPEYNFAAMPVVGEPPPAVGRAAARSRSRPTTRRRGRSASTVRSPRRCRSARASTREPEDVAGIPSPTYLPFVTRGRHRAALRRAAGPGGGGGRRRRRSSARSAVVRWTWRTDGGAPMTRLVIEPRAATAQRRVHRPAWWGMVMLVATEAMVFLALLSAYFFAARVGARVAAGRHRAAELHRSVVFSVVLLGSSIPIVWAEHARSTRPDAPGRRSRSRSRSSWARCSSPTPSYDFLDLEFGSTTTPTRSLFCVIPGLHGLHVLVGLLMSAMVQVKAWTGRIDPGTARDPARCSASTGTSSTASGSSCSRR